MDNFTPKVRGSHGFLLCFSFNNHDSFNELQNIYDQILHVKNDVKPPIILVGTKCDIEGSQRQVSKEDAKAFASKLGCEYFEVSAMTNYHVKEAFECIAQKTYDFVQSKKEQEKEKSKKEKKNKFKEVCLI